MHPICKVIILSFSFFSKCTVSAILNGSSMKSLHFYHEIQPKHTVCV